jgi:hypothetical protein
MDPEYTNPAETLARHAISHGRFYGLWDVEQVGKLAIILHDPKRVAASAHTAIIEMLEIAEISHQEDLILQDCCFCIITDAPAERWPELSQLTKQVIESQYAGDAPRRLDMKY